MKHNAESTISTISLIPSRALRVASSVVAATLMLIGAAQAQTLITPAVSSFSSELSALGRFATDAVNGSGMSGPGSVTDTHDNKAASMWMAGGVYVGGDRNPFITLDLGAPYDLLTTRIWTWNEPGFTQVGPKTIVISTSSDNVTFVPISTNTPAQGLGNNSEPAQDFPTAKNGVRYVQIQILENWDGAVYWNGEAGPDGTDGRHLTGLAEVRFVVSGNIALPPLITKHPSNQTNDVGTAVMFTAAANDNGSPPLSYRWRKNGANLSDDGHISGSTTANLTINDIAAADEGSYDVIVSNPNGSVISNPANLAVRIAATRLITPTVIAYSSQNPYGIDRAASHVVDGSGMSGPGLATDTHDNAATPNMWTTIGTTASPADADPYLVFDLGVTGDLEVTRIWNYNEGGSFSSFGPSDIRLLTSLDGTSFTRQATITPAQAGGISAEPAQDFATLVAKVRYVRFEILKTHGGAEFWDTHVDAFDPRNLTGLSEVRFEINSSTISPSITQQPQSRTAIPGSTVTFNVVASANGAPPLSFQWRKNGVNLSNGGNISGALSATLSVSNIGAADAGNYDVVVSNPNGSATSAITALTVIPPPTASIALHAGISFEGTVGIHYRAEYRNAVDPADVWQTLQDIPNLPATPYTVYDPAPATTPKRFYRVIYVQ